MENHQTKKHSFLPFSFFPWHQTPLSAQELSALELDECRNMSIRTKILLLFAIALSIFALTSAVIGYQLYMDSAVEQNKRLGEGITRLIAETIDADKVDDYLASGTSADAKDYIETERRLQHIMETWSSIKYIYVYRITDNGCQVVFDLDTANVSGSRPGDLIPLDPSLEPFRRTLLDGGNIPPVISNDDYGWLLTVYAPIYNSKGICQCYAGIDISMEDLRIQSRDFIVKLCLIFIFLFAVILLIVFRLAKYHLILPINTMAHSAGIFAYHTDEALEQSLERISRLDIHTGDEVENLYRSFVKMTRDSVRYMTDIRSKNETIARMQTALILTLADMVERRDKNTGHHIKKTAAYVKIIAEELKRMGAYPEILTDDYIRNMVESAPLHDVGKIAIPDAILNKPGKLTEEEFNLMKTHTTAGGKIIGSLIETVPDSDYLYEARNLAIYHHEKWNGKGYPSGLSGEGIPLSSRIMAVADVFDALISHRSYKKGFPYDKALAIIREERGSQFDPVIVDAFFAAKDKILKVADEFTEMEELQE